MTMNNNQTKNSNKYIVTGDTNIQDYPVKENKQEKTKTPNIRSAQQRRAGEALKLSNPFKGV